MKDPSRLRPVPKGQGMFTTLAMAAERLRASLDTVNVIGGILVGRGDNPITGNALHPACGEARANIAKVAEHVLESTRPSSKSWTASSAPGPIDCALLRVRPPIPMRSSAATAAPAGS
ncbi:hypothetical protein MPL1032_180066 [Mesorhizobium plurifarium]|uniref:Uncharacterized protein n=1 Tax=Mesorhizobium plurifarium TaxID=69974 RepID=A0A0K2VU85_MESPL|nr:hypothetical protein MPL1032_180066 [Mesorhizobium plurifarium]